jgi:hypothetical protein
MRTTPTTISAGLLALLVSATASGQHLVLYDPPPGPGMFVEVQLASPLLPGGAPTAFYPNVPILPPPPLVAPPPGDSTFDSVTVRNWFTNGAILAQTPTPAFPPVGPVMPAFPIAPAVLAAIGAAGGLVTGIAIDSAAGIMYLTAAPGMVIGVAPIPGTPVLVPPFVPGFAMGPICGLDWDAITGTLLAVDFAGVVYQFLPGGLPFAPPTPPFPMPAPPGDVAIDKTGFLTPLGLRSIYVNAGPMVFDVTGGALPIPTPAVAPTGLAFLAKAASNMPGGACACGPIMPVLGTSGPMVSGNGAFAITVGGLPPGTPVLMAYDIVFNPLFPPINVTGCGLGIIPPSLTVVSFFTLAGPGGVAAWPLPLFLPPGIGPVFNQNLFPCTVDPAGFTLTPMQQITVCGV